MKMLFHEVQHFSSIRRKSFFLHIKVCLWIFLLVRKQYILAQNCQNPFQAILRLKKKPLSQEENKTMTLYL